MLSKDLIDELNLLFADDLEFEREAFAGEARKNWACPTVIDHVGKYLVVPLTTPKKVKSEGYLMQNCIREYISECMKGTYLVFSVRSRTGERIATLGVKKDVDYWVYDDCLGKENEPVMEKVFECCDDEGNPCYMTDYTELYSVAHEVVRLLNTRNKELL